MIFDNLKILRK